jgi:hypothetical protein
MASRTRTARPLLVVSAVLLLGGCASRTGGRATEGALEAIRAPPPEGTPRVADRIARETTQGALGELTSPRGLAQISTVMDTAVTRSLDAALRTGEGPSGVASRLLLQRTARDLATASGAAFSAEIQRALGPDGRGPLATSLGATAENVSGSVMRGAQGELGPLFPQCAGEDRRVCLEAEVRSLGRAASAGFMEGIASSMAWPTLALAFAVGVAFSVLLGFTWSLFHRSRRLPPERREART